MSIILVLQKQLHVSICFVQVLHEAEAPLNLAKLPDTPMLKAKLTELKNKLGLQFINTDNGFKVRGSLSHLSEFEKAIGLREDERLDTDIIIDFKENSKVDEVYRFLEGQPWGNVSGGIMSSSNIKLDPARLCFLLLDKKDQVIELLKDCNGQMKVKRWVSDEITLKLETGETRKNLEEEIEKFCNSNSLMMESFSLCIENVREPQRMISQMKRHTKSYMLAIKLVDRKKKNYILTVLDLKSRLQRSRPQIEHIADKFCGSPVEPAHVILALCDGHDKHLDALEEGSTVYTQTEHVKDNGSAETTTQDVEPLVTPQPDTLVSFEKDLFVGDHDVISYMREFHQMRIHNIEKKFGIEVGWEKINEDKLIIRAKPSQIEEGEEHITRLAQAVFQSRHEFIDITKLDPEKYQKNKQNAFDVARKLGFLIRQEGDSKLFIMGPGEKRDECAKAVKIALGISGRRRLLSKTMSNGTLTDEVTKPRTPLTKPELAPKAYTCPNTNINILAWKVDITKLHVDVVVNAANEDLLHGAGIYLIYRMLYMLSQHDLQLNIK